MEVVRLIESLQTDTIEFTLMESNEDSSILKIRNKALILDVETGNGRVYPSDVVATAIKEAKERMDNHECLGTVNGHPEDIYPEPDVTSHYVTKAWIEDGYLVTESVVMCNTHYGRTLKGLIESDAAIGVSVRGTGSVTGNRVTSYQFESFDFVGTPSTGLRVKPTILGSTQVESMKNKVVSYIKENNSKCTKTNDIERKQMATMSFPEFKKIMTECIEHVKSAKNLTEANSRIAQVSSKISQLPTVDAGTAPFGQESIRGVFKEWEETEFNVVNRAVKTPSEAANSQEDANKDSMAMKAATKEAVQQAADILDKAKGELTESQNKIAALTKRLKDSKTETLRENQKVAGMSALRAKDKVVVKEARELLVQAQEQLTESRETMLVESEAKQKLATENAGFRKALIESRKETLAEAKKNRKLEEEIMELKKQVSAGGTIKESSEVAALKRKFARLLKENMDLKQQNEMMQGFVDDATAELEASGDATKLLVATEMALEEAVTRLVLNGLDK